MGDRLSVCACSDQNGFSPIDAAKIVWHHKVSQRQRRSPLSALAQPAAWTCRTKTAPTQRCCASSCGLRRVSRRPGVGGFSVDRCRSAFYWCRSVPGSNINAGVNSAASMTLAPSGLADRTQSRVTANAWRSCIISDSRPYLIVDRRQ